MDENNWNFYFFLFKIIIKNVAINDYLWIFHWIFDIFKISLSIIKMLIYFYWNLLQIFITNIFNVVIIILNKNMNSNYFYSLIVYLNDIIIDISKINNISIIDNHN